VVVTASNSAGSGQARSAQVGPVLAAGPTKGQVRSALDQILSPHGRVAKIGMLLKKGGYTFSFKAPSAGKLVLEWYYVPKGAHITKKVKSKPKAVLVASASVVLHRVEKAKVRLKLTGKGRSLLKHAKREKLTTKATFTPVGEPKTTTTKTITVKN
jgi:hypothetical protein